MILYKTLWLSIYHRFYHRCGIMVILCDLCDSLIDKQSKIGFKINKDKSYIKYNDNDYLKSIAFCLQG